MAIALLERNALAEALSREVARVSVEYRYEVNGESKWSHKETADCFAALEAAHAAFAVPCPTQAAFAQKRALERLQEIK